MLAASSSVVELALVVSAVAAAVGDDQVITFFHHMSQFLVARAISGISTDRTSEAAEIHIGAGNSCRKERQEQGCPPPESSPHHCATDGTLLSFTHPSCLLKKSCAVGRAGKQPGRES